MTTDRSNLPFACLAYFATYYLFDIDYPKPIKTTMSVMHSVLFSDHQCPKEVLEKVNTILNEYQNFKIE